MQPKYSKPLRKSISFWGLLIILILIFLFLLYLAGGTIGVLMVASLGFAAVPIIGIMAVLAISFVVFGIIFTAYLTRRLGGIILSKRQINKPILYTSLVFGVILALGAVFILVVYIPSYLAS